MQKELFKVNDYELDIEQKEVVLSEARNILVIAGAGSGKSMTIIGKIKYLLNKQNMNKEEILCVSFTNDSCNSLKNNLIKNNIDIEVLTFHKLGMKILKDNKQHINIINENLLELIIDNFFNSTIYEQPKYMLYVLKYKRKKYNKYNYLKKYEELLDKNEIKEIKQIISKFINLFKANGFEYQYTFAEKYEFFLKKA